MPPSKEKKEEEPLISDTEDEEDDPIKNEVALRVQESTSVIMRAFRTFLSEPAWINNTGDPSTTIVDRTYKRCYNIPALKVSKFFKYLDHCRRKNLKMSMYEKQLEYSGIMLDFDIYQLVSHTQLSKEQFHRLCINVFKLLIKYLDIEDENMEIIVGITRKPKVQIEETDDDGVATKYKDGFHMLIPGIQVTRPFKKFLITKILEEKIMEKTFHDLEPHHDYERADFMDMNSAFVGVHFLGSATKVNKPCYELTNVFKVKVNIEHDDIIPVDYDSMIEESYTDLKLNLCHEFSLNWEKSEEKGGIIRKKHYDPKPEVEPYIQAIESKQNEVESLEEFEEDTVHGEMSLLNIHDPNALYIKSILDILDVRRAEQYKPWFQVLCVLAHASPNYKPLAEYFSKRVPENYDPVRFEATWESAMQDSDNNLSLGSLYYWAQQDNPDRYSEVRQRSVYTILYKKIYELDAEGILEHYDVAEILYKMLNHKYKFDREEGETHGNWYEFIIEDEPMEQGELFKWRKYNTRKPSSLMRYISEVLPKLFRRVLDRIKSTYEESAGDFAKYHGQIYNNFKRTCRSLRNSGFKRGVVSEAEDLFEAIGFAKSMDNNPVLKGVGNGILHLGKKSVLITGFHGHRVSKFTPVNYKKLDPRCPKTKKLMKALRNMFPDDEPDTFNWLMHYLASTLDSKKKESLMLLMVGGGANGKSFLMELHKAAIGDKYSVKLPLSFLTSRSKDAESATPAIMMLKEANLAYYSESNRNEVLNMAKIKELTGQESIAGRKLRQDLVNFKPKCHHLVTTNNDFEIDGQGHGEWRRIMYMLLKITFRFAHENYDPENPYERLADEDMDGWSEDPEILAIYLGLIVYYYESLQTKYNGKVKNVPHPHIKKDTQDFRNRQDTLNNFINMFLVKCPDSKKKTPLSDVIEKYVTWFQNIYPDNKSFKRGLADKIENSVLQKFIKKTRRGSFLVGYRILGQTEEKEDDEVYYSEEQEEKESSIKIKPENAKKYHERILKEFLEKNKIELDELAEKKKHRSYTKHLEDEALKEFQSDDDSGDEASDESEESDSDIEIDLEDARNNSKLEMPKKRRMEDITVSKRDKRTGLPKQNNLDEDEDVPKVSKKSSKSKGSQKYVAKKYRQEQLIVEAMLGERSDTDSSDDCYLED